MPRSSVPLTRDRLRFLYCVAGFSCREICEDIVNWKIAEVKSAIRRWKLGRQHETYMNARELLRAEVLKALVSRHDEAFSRDIVDAAASRTSAGLRSLVSSGELSWQKIDARLVVPTGNGFRMLVAPAAIQAIRVPQATIRTAQRKENARRKQRSV